MQLKTIITLHPAAVTSILAEVQDQTSTLTDTFFGEATPTRMLFAPESGFPASLHYMFFARGSRQQFHWHPGGRHLVILGDTALTIRTNPCDTRVNPYDSPVVHAIAPYTLAAIRLAGHTWHEFSACDEDGTGIVAFSFHDCDDLVSTSPTLMDELTTFWDGSLVVTS